MRIAHTPIQSRVRERRTILSFWNLSLSHTHTSTHTHTLSHSFTLFWSRFLHISFSLIFWNFPGQCFLRIYMKHNLSHKSIFQSSLKVHQVSLAGNGDSIWAVETFDFASMRHLDRWCISKLMPLAISLFLMGFISIVKLCCPSIRNKAWSTKKRKYQLNLLFKSEVMIRRYLRSKAAHFPVVFFWFVLLFICC